MVGYTRNRAFTRLRLGFFLHFLIFSFFFCYYTSDFFLQNMKFATCFILNSLSISNNWPNFHEAIDIKASYARIPMQLVYIYIYIILPFKEYFFLSFINSLLYTSDYPSPNIFKKKGGGISYFCRFVCFYSILIFHDL